MMNKDSIMFLLINNINKDEIKKINKNKTQKQKQKEHNETHYQRSQAPGERPCRSVWRRRETGSAVSPARIETHLFFIPASNNLGRGRFIRSFQYVDLRRYRWQPIADGINEKSLTSIFFARGRKGGNSVLIRRTKIGSCDWGAPRGGNTNNRKRLQRHLRRRSCYSLECEKKKIK